MRTTCIVAQGGFVCAEQLGQPAPRFAPGRGPKGHEGVERRLPESFAIAESATVEQTSIGEDRKIEDCVADRDPDPWSEPGRWPEDPVGQVVDREM